MSDVNILGFDDQFSAVRHGIRCIDTQIHENLFTLAGVSLDRGKLGIEFVLYRYIAWRCAKKQKVNLFYYGVEVQPDLPVSGFSAEYQKTLCKVFSFFNNCLDLFKYFIVWRAIGLIRQCHFRVSEYAVQDIVEIMCNTAGKRC